jgi:predicted Holliday junction resolvase-like endonuclease
VKKYGLTITLIILVMLVADIGMAADKSEIQKEIEQVKEKIQDLEQKLEEREAVEKKQAGKIEKKIDEKIGEALEAFRHAGDPRRGDPVSPG